jgi:RNA polymerase sigma factor (sigma-70 family)
MAILDPVDHQAAALDEVFRAHRRDLVALCRRRLGSGPDAEDAAHEAMLRAWRARASLEEARDPWPWLATIAGNVCIDVHRRRATARSYVVPPVDAPFGPEDHVVRSTHDDLLREALAQLSPSRREALLLREVEDWDYGRIAAHQRKSAGSVRTAVTRARQELRDHVESLARARDQWPLAGLTGGLVDRVRARYLRMRADVAATAARASARVDIALDAATTAASSSAAHVAIGGLMVLTLTGTTGGPATNPVDPTVAAVSAPAATASTPTDRRTPYAVAPASAPIDPLQSPPWTTLPAAALPAGAPVASPAPVTRALPSLAVPVTIRVPDPGTSVAPAGVGSDPVAELLRP